MRKFVLLGVLFPGLAWGADVRLTLAGSAEYDNNIERAEEGKKEDLVFRLTPGVRLVEDRETFNYSLGYALPYEIGVTHGSINDLNQLFDGSFRYRVSPQTEVFGNDGFFYVRGLFSQDSNLEDPTTGDVGDNRDRVLQNNVSVGVKHQFTPRLSGTVLVNNGYYDTNQFARANVLSFGGNLSSEYQLTPHHSLGGGFSYSRQNFQDTFNRPKSETNYYNLFGSWEWLFDETTTFEIQAGPALIDSSQDSPPTLVMNQQPIPFSPVGNSLGLPNNDDAIVVGDFTLCPVEDIKNKNTGIKTPTPLLFNNKGDTCGGVLLVPPANAGEIAVITGLPLTDLPYRVGNEPSSVDDTRITFFAGAQLTKRWSPNLASSIGYTRQENGAAGIDGGAVLDAVTLTNTWRISERWDFGVRTDWTQRKSATDGSRVFIIATANAVGVLGFPVAGAGEAVQVDSSDSLNTQRWGTAARLAYRLTKNTVTSLQYAYNKQKSHGDTVGQESDFDNHLVTLTVQYNFEPIGLPW